MPEKPTRKPERWRVQITNHASGHIIAVDDTRAACEAVLAAQEKQHGKDALTIEWARLE